MRYATISYTLSDAPAIITLEILTNDVALPAAAVTRLSGAVNRLVEPGSGREIIWNAGADWPEQVDPSVTARITAWAPDNPPQYCMVDIAGGHQAASWPLHYYTSLEALPNGVDDIIYKSVCLLLRRVEPTEPGGFSMGSPATGETGRQETQEGPVNVVLSHPYYIGVYQVTQGQWELVMGDILPGISRFSNNQYTMTRPVEQVTCCHIREDAANNSEISPNWPASSAVHANSFMGRLRARTKLPGFDLPTDAQWEYACRAGTLGALNNGTPNLANSTEDAQLALLGRYNRNGGVAFDDEGKVSQYADSYSDAGGTAKVGSYLPNAWGLYDFHGNLREWCLDCYEIPPSGGFDPRGPAPAKANPDRQARGGCYNTDAEICRSGARHFGDAKKISQFFGFRVACRLGEPLLQ